MKQQEGETLREYVKRFNKVVLEINKANDHVRMTTFQAGLNNPDLVFSLGKIPPTTMTDLMFKAQKYMKRKDALTANGIYVQKMEEFNELQHKKKEKKDRSPNQKNDNENTQAHTRSTSILEEELVTLNHSTANSYLVHGM